MIALDRIWNDWAGIPLGVIVGLRAGEGRDSDHP